MKAFLAHTTTFGCVDDEFVDIDMPHGNLEHGMKAFNLPCQLRLYLLSLEDCSPILVQHERFQDLSTERFTSPQPLQVQPNPYQQTQDQFVSETVRLSCHSLMTPRSAEPRNLLVLYLFYSVSDLLCCTHSNSPPALSLFRCWESGEPEQLTL